MLVKHLVHKNYNYSYSNFIIKSSIVDFDINEYFSDIRDYKLLIVDEGELLDKLRSNISLKLNSIYLIWKNSKNYVVKINKILKNIKSKLEKDQTFEASISSVSYGKIKDQFDLEFSWIVSDNNIILFNNENELEEIMSASNRLWYIDILKK